MCEILRQANYRVTTAFDGGKGLSLLGSENFDLILLDLKLPGMDGRTLLKLIKEARPGMKVIVLTGSPIGEDFYLKDGFLCSDAIDDSSLKIADGVLSKPCNMDVVLEKIEEICKAA